jgi:hypothetical protein
MQETNTMRELDCNLEEASIRGCLKELCLCVCVCEREREREDKVRERVLKGIRERVISL